MRQVDVYAFSVDPLSGAPILFLKTREGNLYLPIWMGQYEANLILMLIQGQRSARPLTHDLLVAAIGKLDGEVEKVSLSGLVDNTYLATISLNGPGGEIELDARPSDAFTVALMTGVPIYISEPLLDRFAVELDLGDHSEDEREEKIMGEFRDFLDHVRPDDFREGTGNNDG